jgi:hypothetical protein
VTSRVPEIPERFRAGITRARPEDLDELRRFRLRTYKAGSRQVDEDRQAWLDSNPAVGARGPGLWICRRSGEIVGQQAEIPVDLQVGRDPRRAAWAIDLMVDQAWQLRGIGPGLVTTQMADHTIALGLNLSDKGHATYSKIGWTDLGIVPVYLRPLDAHRTLTVAPVSRRLRRLAPVAGPTLRAADAAAGALLRTTGARLVPVNHLDERVDAVWATAAEHYSVLVRRDRAALSWRIDQRPDSDRLRRYYLMRRNRALGYVVLRPTVWPGPPDRSVFSLTSGSPRSPRRGDVPVVQVVDYLAPPRWVAPLLLAAGRAERRRGAVAMVAKTRNALADRRLRAAGFVRRQKMTDKDMPIRFMVHCSDEPGICALVSDPDSWFVTAADSDLEYATTTADGLPDPDAGSSR